MKRHIVNLLAVVLFCSLVTLSPLATQSGQVQAEEVKASEKKTRRVPTLRAKVYEQLARAQSAADEAGVAEAIQILDEVKAKSDSMNSYERAMMYNFYGFVYYNHEQYDKALESFALVVEQQPIPEKFEMTTLFSLAQLHLMQGNYDQAITFLQRWESLNTGKIPPKNNVLKAQAYYQNKQYTQAARSVAAAIADQEGQGMNPDENWLILQRAVFYELKQPRKVKEVLEKLIKLYDQPQYWLQLAGMYGELGEDKKQLAVMEAAYQRGFVNSAGDIFNLAQLYYYHRVPYKGALLMEKALDEGVLERNLRNLKFLGQSWTLAQEQEKAIPVLMAAAELSDDGELDAQVAQIMLNARRWEDALQAADRALHKGELRNPGLAHLIKGMALYNQHAYAKALNQLAEAEKHPSSRTMAKQWSQFVESEKDMQNKLAVELST